MKEKEFLRELREQDFKSEEMRVRIYYTINENEDVILDDESIREEFEEIIKEIKNII